YDNLHHLINRALRFIQDQRARAAGTGAAAAVTGGAPASAAAPAASAEARRAQARAVLPALRAPLSRERPVILPSDEPPEALAFVGAPRAAALAARGMSTPEHILRCGRLPLFVDASAGAGAGNDLATLPAAQAKQAITSALDGFAAHYRETFAASRPKGVVEMLEPSPRVVLLPGLGLVTAMKDKSNALVGNLCYRHVMRVAD